MLITSGKDVAYVCSFCAFVRQKINLLSFPFAIIATAVDDSNVSILSSKFCKTVTDFHALYQ